MEVFLSNLPVFVNEDSLKRALDPVMNKLGITDFRCEKFRNKTFANVTFLHAQQGQLFLQHHGVVEVPGSAFARHSGPHSAASPFNHAYSRKAQPRQMANLRLFNQAVYCRPSVDPRTKLPRQPNSIIMRVLQRGADERKNPTRKIEKQGEATVFQLESLSCGYCTFLGEQLVYVPEAEIEGIGTAKFTKRTLVIELKTYDLSKNLIKIPLNTVMELVCSMNHSLTLTLSDEPAFFSQTSGALVDLFAALDFKTSGLDDETTQIRLPSLSRRHEEILGQCLVYQLKVSGPDLHKKIAALSRHDTIPYVEYDLVTQRDPPLELGAFRKAMKTLRNELAHYTEQRLLPFDILFQLQALAYNAYLHPGTVLALARELRRVFALDQLQGKRLISTDAMKKLFGQIGWPFVHGDPSYFKVPALVDQLRVNEQQFHDGSSLRDGLLSPTQNLARIYRVSVTPTRITLHGPELEAQNRILRKYPNHHEYFIRVQFCDENGQDLFFNPKISLDQIYLRFKSILRNGIQIAGRPYSFLGFSHSSLRSHSAWFSAPFFDDNYKPQNCFTIVKDLGNFGGIRCPARCAARIGQAFSETPWFVPLDDEGIEVIKVPDYENDDKSRVFSDGVGSMSWEAARAIWNHIPSKKASPTAAQVRFRGVKGMLAVDSRLQGAKILIRPSMEKFTSDDSPILGICDAASKPIRLVLNRQIIKLLEDMGVDNKLFLDLQAVELERLRTVTANPENVASFLTRHDVGESFRLYHFFQHCARLGVDYRKEAFLRSVVEAVVLRELRLLKHKARIPVKEGISLRGVMDETGLLKEGEVYVTYDTLEGAYPPPPGEEYVLVTRSPALHPGDIQGVRNIIPPKDHPLLDHINVIVFNRRGARDLPSQLSGGDLDGDIYNIIWDKRAMPRETYYAADYPRVRPKDLDREVTREDMANFFVDFMKMDHLGVIATRHMILADHKELGSRDEACLKLAELHSTAVDFSKTGIEVDLKKLPRAIRARPDFLAPGPDVHIVDKSQVILDDYVVDTAVDEDEQEYAGPRYEYYRSDKILGHLFRAIDETKIWNQDIKHHVPLTGASFWDEFLLAVKPRYEAIVCSGATAAGIEANVKAAKGEWVSHLATAREIRAEYEDAMMHARQQYSDHPIKPITELEVFIGSIVNKRGVQTRRQRDRSIKLKDQFDRIAGWIHKRMRPTTAPGQQGVPLTGYATELDSLNLCLACVYAGGEKDDQGRREGHECGQSFRVLAASALLEELNLFERGYRGGGYVGVGAGRGRYAKVPPPAEYPN